MDFIDHEQIKDFCYEALETANQYGPHEGLADLIGDKFYQVTCQLREIRNQVKFIYGDEILDNLPSDSPDLRAHKLNYGFTTNENYRRNLAKLRTLVKIQELFIQEIKESFDLKDVQDYFNSYPRMGVRRETYLSQWQGSEKVDSFSVKDVLAEVDDILVVEEMKKMFL